MTESHSPPVIASIKHNHAIVVFVHESVSAESDAARQRVAQVHAASDEEKLLFVVENGQHADFAVEQFAALGYEVAEDGVGFELRGKKKRNTSVPPNDAGRARDSRVDSHWRLPDRD